MVSARRRRMPGQQLLRAVASQMPRGTAPARCRAKAEKAHLGLTPQSRMSPPQSSGAPPWKLTLHGGGSQAQVGAQHSRRRSSCAWPLQAAARLGPACPLHPRTHRTESQRLTTQLSTSAALSRPQATSCCSSLCPMFHSAGGGPAATGVQVGASHACRRQTPHASDGSSTLLAWRLPPRASAHPACGPPAHAVPQSPRGGPAAAAPAPAARPACRPPPLHQTLKLRRSCRARGARRRAAEARTRGRQMPPFAPTRTPP